MKDLTVCLTCGSTQNLLKIEEFTGLQELIKTILEIETHSSFEFICQECKVYLETFRDFKQRAQASVRILSEALLSLNIDANGLKLIEPHRVNRTLQEGHVTTNEHYEVIQPSDLDGPNGYRCLICYRTFSLLSAWRRHNNRIHLTTPQLFECHFCGTKFASKIPLKRHLRRHVDDAFICFKCGLKFYSKYNLEAHLKRHSDDYSYVCPDCQKSYKSTQELKLHRQSHSTQTLFICITCGKNFSSRNGLKRHDEWHQGIIRKIPCPTCGKTFLSNSALRQHTRLHSDERPFRCKTCFQSFRQKVTLEKHIYAHSGLRPFNCIFENCLKGFYCPEHLRKHLKDAHDYLEPVRIEKQRLKAV